MRRLLRFALSPLTVYLNLRYSIPAHLRERVDIAAKLSREIGGDDD